MNRNSIDDFNFDFRPVYFVPLSLENQSRSRVKGKVRREVVSRQNVSAAAPDPLMQHSLSGGLRDAWGRIHPSFMGGEYLPDLIEFEVEIARVTLKSTTGDVVSIRARKNRGKYTFRVNDEYGGIYELPDGLKETRATLSLGELIYLMDETVVKTCEGGYEFAGLVKPFIEQLKREGGLSDFDRGFLRVDSKFYPDLHEYYEIKKDLWARKG